MGVTGWLGLVKVSFDPDGRTADFRFVLLGLAVVATSHLLVRCYITPGRARYEAGRQQGRREVIAEMNGMPRRRDSAPVELAERRVTRGHRPARV